MPPFQLCWHRGQNPWKGNFEIQSLKNCSFFWYDTSDVIYPKKEAIFCLFCFLCSCSSKQEGRSPPFAPFPSAPNPLCCVVVSMDVGGLQIQGVCKLPARKIKEIWRAVRKVVQIFYFSFRKVPVLNGFLPK